MTPIEQAVLELKHLHSTTWAGKPESYWFAALAEEFGELGASLNGEHEHDPDFELRQIATICLNWLERREAIRRLGE